MRDIDTMIAMLRKASEQPNGMILALEFEGGEGGHERHQAQLLADCGLMEWVSNSAVRITNTGYDFLEGLNRRGALGSNSTVTYGWAPRSLQLSQKRCSGSPNTDAP